MIMVYKWGFMKYSVDANKVGEIVEKIEKEKGKVTHQDLVDVARPKKSAIHGLFEWDDSKAAEKYRLDQARQILHNLTIVRENKEPIRAYVNIVKSTGIKNIGHYANIQSAMENEQSREVVLANALAELQAFQRKYSELKELARLFMEIDNLIEETKSA